MRLGLLLLVASSLLLREGGGLVLGIWLKSLKDGCAEPVHVSSRLVMTISRLMPVQKV